MREFGLRVLFQMGANDSSALMDSPAASRLGRNRALFVTDETSQPEKFRPYGMPSNAWLTMVRERLQGEGRLMRFFMFCSPPRFGEGVGGRGLKVDVASISSARQPPLLPSGEGE